MSTTAKVSNSRYYQIAGVSYADYYFNNGMVLVVDFGKNNLQLKTNTGIVVDTIEGYTGTIDNFVALQERIALTGKF